MAITILQQPLFYTPSNAQHVYTASSTLTGNTDFRYVFDVWLNPRQSNAERVARLKIAPNTYGVGIADVGDIVKNYLIANPRSSYFQATSSSSTSNITTPNGLLINAQASGSTSGIAGLSHNNFNTNSAYEYLPHIAEYCVLIGQQWSVNGIPQVEICEDPSLSPSTFTYELGDLPAAYLGSPNTIFVSGAGANLPSWGVPEALGWSYVHNDSLGNLVASGTSTAQTGSYTATLQPNGFDVLYMIENYSGIFYSFVWGDEVTGWGYVSTYIPPCMNQPGFMTIWPGVQENLTNFNYNNIYWTGNTNGSQNQMYWEQYKYKFASGVNSYTAITENNPAQFLTTFGDELFQTKVWTGVQQSVSRVRRRSHHPECPVLLSYFGSDFQPNFSSWNISGTSINYSLTQDQDYSNSANLVFTGTPSGYTTVPDNRILYTIIRNPSWINSGGKLAVWMTSDTAWDNRISEVVEYYFMDNDCLSTPIHFLFLNQRGTWDTWSFDRKHIKSQEKSNSIYAQGVIRNSPRYNPFFYQKRDIIYDQNVDVIVEAQTNFMDENDRKIVEEIFLSTDVYLIEDWSYPGDGATAYQKTPYLIPIVIESNSLQDYKNRYNKLFQYTLTFRYNPVQLKRSNL